MSYKIVQTYDTQTKQWGTKEFKSKMEFKNFVWSKFKKPGELKLKNTWAFRQEATKYEQQGFYCDSPFRSTDYVQYWNNEKDKCLNGLIVDDFYLTGYYYWWINFLPINDKMINKLKFPDIWDSQYYFFIYVLLCELEYKYSVIVKKRQWGSTFQHIAILLNDIWFQNAYINKIGASDEDYILADWQIMEEYRNFLNANTGWYRHFTPDQIFNWQQRLELNIKGRKRHIGNKSIIKGINFKLSPTKGVGGKNNKFFYEEAGITKTMKKTFQYIDPALKMGALTTGMFMAGGSVGELEQCEDLREMAFNPEGSNILKIENTFNEASEYREICFFVPEYWSMPPYIDEEGNSLIDEAKAYLIEDRERVKKTSSPEDERMHISQHPMTIEEAFAYRKESIFPLAKVIKQQERIISNNTKPLLVTIQRDKEGKLHHKMCDDCRPLEKFPLPVKAPKEGAITMWEPPIANPPMFTYFAGVDPIAVDKTRSSPSMFCIYIVKNLTETTYKEDGETKVKVDGYKIVASYTGRYDDLTKTNEIAEGLILYYNALACIENNVLSFINHMQSKGLQRYMATRDQLSFVSELKTNIGSYCPYGFKMNQTIWTYFVGTMLDYLTEELDVVRKHNSDEVVKTVYGVERINDYQLLEEMRLYHDKLNVDRLVAFGAALAIMKSYSKYNIGVQKINETEEQKPKVIKAPPKSFFRNVGAYQVESQPRPQRSYFKNYK